MIAISQGKSESNDFQILTRRVEPCGIVSVFLDGNSSILFRDWDLIANRNWICICLRPAKGYWLCSLRWYGGRIHISKLAG